jgi:hypothetical protein
MILAQFANFDFNSSIEQAATAPLNFIVNYIAPFIVLTYAFGLLLEKIGIFKSSGVKYVIGAALSGFLVFAFNFGAMGLWLGIAGILIFKMKDWPSRIISFIIFAVIISQIGFTLDPNILISKGLIIGLGVFAILIMLTEMSPLQKIIIAVILIIAYFVIISYIPTLKL